MRWCEKSVKEEAVKYSTRNEFKDKSSGAYGYALRHKIIDDVCHHMGVVGDRYNRFIYKIIFPKINAVYVGLTFNLNERKFSHISNSSNKYVKSLMLNKEEYIWECDDRLIKQDDVGEVEKNLIEEYKDNGWDVLNISSGGGLGGGYSWTPDLAKYEALKYSTRSEFCDKSKGAYHYARRVKILYEICSHMKNKWSFDLIKLEAFKYETKTEFKNNCKSGYYYAYRNKFLDEICSHMLKKVW